MESEFLIVHYLSRDARHLHLSRLQLQLNRKDGFVMSTTWTRGY